MSKYEKMKNNIIANDVGNMVWKNSGRKMSEKFLVISGFNEEIEKIACLRRDSLKKSLEDLLSQDW